MNQNTVGFGLFFFSPESREYREALPIHAEGPWSCPVTQRVGVNVVTKREISTQFSLTSMRDHDDTSAIFIFQANAQPKTQPKCATKRATKHAAKRVIKTLGGIQTANLQVTQTSTQPSLRYFSLMNTGLLSSPMYNTNVTEVHGTKIFSTPADPVAVNHVVSCFKTLQRAVRRAYDAWRLTRVKNYPEREFIERHVPWWMELNLECAGKP